MKAIFHEEEISCLRKINPEKVDAVLNTCPRGFTTRWDIATHQPREYDRAEYAFGNYLVYYLEHWGLLEKTERPPTDPVKYTYWQMTEKGLEFLHWPWEEKSSFINERVVKELKQYV